MKLLRDYTFKWWQVSLLKLYVGIAGIIVGVYYSKILVEWMDVLVGIFVILLIYFVYIMLAKKI